MIFLLILEPPDVFHFPWEFLFWKIELHHETEKFIKFQLRSDP